MSVLGRLLNQNLQPTGRVSIVFLVTALCLGATLIACGDNNTSSAAIGCNIAADCPESQTCVENADGALFCMPMECDCADCAACPAGSFCLNHFCESLGDGPCTGSDCLNKNCLKDTDCGGNLICVSGICKAPCSSDTDCPGEVCDLQTNSCVPVAETDTVSDNCQVSGCSTGMVCDETSGECIADEDGGGSGNGNTCASCTNDESCTSGKCTGLGGGTYCLNECVTNGDCPSGYKCFNVQGAGPRCVPGGYTCELDCIQNGCESNQVCDLATGNCVAQLELCQSCTKDEHCGETALCVTFAPSDKRCMPKCGASDNCEAGGTCAEVEGSKVCKPTTAKCCYGAQCDAPVECDNCVAPDAYCFEGQCVECLNSTHCKAPATCNAVTHKCEGTGAQGCGSCVPPTAYCHPQKQLCVECINSSQCSAGEFCDPAQSICTGDICSACAPPYPACAEINGEKACVQCIQDSDCQSGDCNETTYLCSGNAIPTGNCKSDADCPTGTQFALACDPGTGLCYDITGACDDVSAFCNAATGSKCVSIFDIFGGGGVPSGGIPGLPGGAFGLCTCSPIPAELCAIAPQLCGTSTGTCFGTMTCNGLLSLLNLLLGGGSVNTGFENSSFCN